MKNKLGQVFTNEKIIDLILDEIDIIKNYSQKTIIDPSCGEGSILTSIVKRLEKENIEKYIHGYEIDENIINKCTEKLNQIYETNWNIEKCNALYKGNQEKEKYDLIIGNPPYISYNECKKQKIINNKKIKMSNFYGINLNTVKGRKKAYSPKPNLYAFFIALGLYILKKDGRLCYIIPQTVLINTDLDVIRYHLSEKTTIEKIILFDEKIFKNEQKKPIITSSLIIIIKKQIPNKEHKIKIIKNNEEKEISQIELRNNIFNWSFIKNDEDYKKQLKSYNNHLTIHQYRSTFRNYDDIIIDGSVNILKKDIITEIKNDEINQYYIIPKMINGKYTAETLGYYKKTLQIKKAQGNRNHRILTERKYKIIWKYINFDHFYFIEKNDVLPMYQQYCIASNYKSEILFLLSILNSTINLTLLEKTFKIGNENRLSFLLGLTFLKEFIRIPKITEQTRRIKENIIIQTEKLLETDNNEIIKKNIDEMVFLLYNN